MSATAERVRTLEELWERLGCVPLSRIAADPAPGTATEDDLLRRSETDQRIYELVDGVLVEKPMGFRESLIASALIGFLRMYLSTRRLGVVPGADGAIRLLPHQVRAPDVAFITWERLEGHDLNQEKVPALAPDLAVEVLSEGNAPGEMQRKLEEYFEAGVRLVWYAEPETWCVTVFTSPADRRLLTADDVLDGGDVLPGFQLSIREWFEQALQRPDQSDPAPDSGRPS